VGKGKRQPVVGSSKRFKGSKVLRMVEKNASGKKASEGGWDNQKKKKKPNPATQGDNYMRKRDFKKDGEGH